jgi:hypothetical protein
LDIFNNSIIDSGGNDGDYSIGRNSFVVRGVNILNALILVGFWRIPRSQSRFVGFGSKQGGGGSA